MGVLGLTTHNALFVFSAKLQNLLFRVIFKPAVKNFNKKGGERN